MMPVFNGDEIVQLKQNYPDIGLQAGDCGWVWGVYSGYYGEPPEWYEATFRRADGEELDHEFAPDDVNLVIGVTKEQFFAQA